MFIINYYKGEEFPWYVQQVNYLDYGRFTTKEAAEEHLKFLNEEE